MDTEIRTQVHCARQCFQQRMWKTVDTINLDDQNGMRIADDEEEMDDDGGSGKFKLNLRAYSFTYFRRW